MDMTCEHKWKKIRGLDSIRFFKCKCFQIDYIEQNVRNVI